MLTSQPSASRSLDVNLGCAPTGPVPDLKLLKKKNGGKKKEPFSVFSGKGNASYGGNGQTRYVTSSTSEEET